MLEENANHEVRKVTGERRYSTKTVCGKGWREPCLDTWNIIQIRSPQSLYLCWGVEERVRMTQNSKWQVFLDTPRGQDCFWEKGGRTNRRGRYGIYNQTIFCVYHHIWVYPYFRPLRFKAISFTCDILWIYPLPWEDEFLSSTQGPDNFKTIYFNKWKIKDYPTLPPNESWKRISHIFAFFFWVCRLQMQLEIWEPNSLKGCMKPLAHFGMHLQSSSGRSTPSIPLHLSDFFISPFKSLYLRRNWPAGHFNSLWPRFLSVASPEVRVRSRLWYVDIILLILEQASTEVKDRTKARAKASDAAVKCIVGLEW